MTIYTSITSDIDPDRKDVNNLRERKTFVSDRRNSRIAKILPHLFYPNASLTVYHDGNFFLKEGALEKLQRMMDGEILVFKHPERECIYDEMKAILDANKTEDPYLLGFQKQTYQYFGYPEKNGLYCGFFIMRRNNERVRRFNEKWWSHYCRFSDRDQISLPYVLWEMEKESADAPEVQVLPIDNLKETPYFCRVGHQRPRTTHNETLD